MTPTNDAVLNTQEPLTNEQSSIFTNNNNNTNNKNNSMLSLQALAHNPVFAGGAGVAGLALAGGIGRHALLAALAAIERRATATLEVVCKDRAYAWMLPWITQQTHRSARHVAVATTLEQNDSGAVTSQFSFVPAPGIHWFWYSGRLVKVERKRDAGSIDLRTGEPWETVNLTAYGADRSVFQRMLNEARSEWQTRQEGKIIIYCPNGTQWIPFGEPRRARPVESVVLDVGISERLIVDLQEFTRSRKWYMDRGIPYRRGYLLHGPPGNGKSTLIYALAGHMRYNICMLNLNDRGLTDDRLAVLLSVVPPRSIILLEDIDAAIPSVRRTAAQESRAGYSVTFSGLLQVLDGIVSGEERVVFMTTNHVDRLDPALIRPGRVDVNQLIGMSTAHQQRQMFLRFYPDQTDDAERFVAAIAHAEGQLSVALLQLHFLMHKDDPKQAVEDAPRMAAEAVQTAFTREAMQQQEQMLATSQHSSQFAAAKFG